MTEAMKNNRYSGKGINKSIPEHNVSARSVFFEAHFLDNQNRKDYLVNSIPGVQCELFEMIWVKRGKGTFTVDLEKYLLCDNTLYYLFPVSFVFLNLREN